MPGRSTWLAATTSNVSFSLRLWLRTQPRPRGRVLIVAGDPTSGIDVEYLSPALAAITPNPPEGVDVIPTLAIKIRSNLVRPQEVVDEIIADLQSGVSQFWLIDPSERTVVVYRPDQEPIRFNESAELNGEPELPGYKVLVRSFFEDIDP